MNKKLITILPSILLILSLTGCKQQQNALVEDNTSNDYNETKNGDLKIVEWPYSAKEPNNTNKNGASFIGDITKCGIDNMFYQ